MTDFLGKSGGSLCTIIEKRGHLTYTKAVRQDIILLSSEEQRKSHMNIEKGSISSGRTGEKVWLVSLETD